MKLVFEAIAGAAAPAALRASRLDHEVGDDAVELQPVVEALVGELHEVGHRLGCLVVVKLDPDRSPAGLDRGDFNFVSSL